MHNAFLAFMSKFTELSEEEAQLMIESYPVRKYKKGSELLRQGQVARDAFLVLDGCVRKYRLVDGVEKTTSFYTDEEVAIEFDSLANQTPSQHYLGCVVDSTIAIINSEKEQAYYKRFPRFEKLAREQMEIMIGNSQTDLSTFITLSPEERYLHLVRHRPQLLRIVPQHQIASYIGVTPESLSRIRKRIAKNSTRT